MRANRQLVGETETKRVCTYLGDAMMPTRGRQHRHESSSATALTVVRCLRSSVEPPLAASVRQRGPPSPSTKCNKQCAYRHQSRDYGEYQWDLFTGQVVLVTGGDALGSRPLPGVGPHKVRG